MYEPTRGGTRGGQAEFKWSDVSADKDRENYLGHSINAPTGRWQKNKDVHWYNRDLKDSEEERREEIRKIKEAEAEAMSVALGFKPAPKPGGSSTEPATGANATIVPPKTEAVSPTGAPPAEHEKEIEKEIEKARKAVEKQAKRERKEQKRAEKEARKAAKKRDRSRSGERRGGERERDRSPEREQYRRRDSWDARRRSASPAFRESGHRRDKGRESPERSPQRSRSPYRRRTRDTRDSVERDYRREHQK
ncbi:hypothetical protein BDV93DRAFT_479093 [Ceratobasidium sp. AG-I]|nr:hypothetical protein BDV93DRAFT_479093 [Ceratobasidium sp. AG-I]